MVIRFRHPSPPLTAAHLLQRFATLVIALLAFAATSGGVKLEDRIVPETSSVEDVELLRVDTRSGNGYGADKEKPTGAAGKKRQGRAFEVMLEQHGDGSRPMPYIIMRAPSSPSPTMPPCLRPTAIFFTSQ